MNDLPLLLADLAAVSVLTFGLYFPRHRRTDLLVAFLVVNVGVLAVAEALSSTTVGAGLGLGLFGVLSIIRLRSSELDQQEIAYYFAALALGLLGGIPTSPSWIAPALMVTLLIVVWAGDHPRWSATRRRQLMTLDRAWTHEPALTAHLTEVLDARIERVTVRKIDLVHDTTQVDVRFHRPTSPASVQTNGLTSLGGAR